MAYDGDKNNKFTPEDFASIETIDKWWLKYIKNNKEKDSNGYTPLGAAVLNSAPLECIAHIMELYTFNKPKTNNITAPFIDVANDISKGRSPIGVACLAMNSDAIDVLRSNYYEYILKDEDGNTIPKLDHYGDPINAEKYVMYTSVPLLDEYTKEEYKYSKKQKLSENYESFPLQYKACEDTEADWLAAATLPKADILIKLIPKVPEGYTKHNYNDITDDNGNTLILLACVADCHESVVYLRDNCSNFNNINTIDSEDNPDQIFIKNNDNLNAFDVALESQDTDLLPLLLGSQPDSDFIDQLLATYFHEKANKKINKVLIALVTAENIYDYYINEYEWGDPAEYTKYIIKYIEDENNISLFNLLLPEYSGSVDGYEAHLTEFFNKMCKRIIAFLYRKSCIPFNTSDQINKLNALLNFHSSNLYVDIVKLLYDSHDVSLKLICDISDSTKRNNCIDKIFTGEYNKRLFIELLKVISNNTNDILDKYTDILTYLYNGGNNGYFTLNNIAALSGDQDLGENKDDLLFNIIYILIANNITTTVSGIDSTYNTFKLNYCVYLYTDKDLEIQYIIDQEYDTTFKCNIINTLYNGENLKLNDIYYIYNHYNNTLSGICKDLKPFIGCMKYIQEDNIITSDFFWAYDFTNHISVNWRNPQKSYVDIPPITDDDLVTVDNSSLSARYKNVTIADATGSVLPIYPSKFRLGVYNYKPEFEIDSAYNATNNQNAMIVAFGSDISSINANINTNIPVQSNNNELYSIESGTYLDNSVNIINWITANPLYAALSNQRCYGKKSDELPVINSIKFNSDFDIDVSLPASGNKITAICGTRWNLPSVSSSPYTDSNGIKYKATGWKIGSDNYSFNNEYTFNETDAIAQLEFEKAAVTLTYQKSNYATLDFILPAVVLAHSGDSVTLTAFDSQYYYNMSGIKYEAKKWTINGVLYNPGSSFIIKDNTIAELKCDIANVTLTYKKPADVTLYNELGNEVTWPSTITRNSGSSITLAALSNKYYNADRTKTYTLTGWTIGSINYNFEDTYILKDDTTATLQYTENTVSIWCNVDFNVPASVTEGSDEISRSFRLSHQPTADVTLNISSTVANRLYIGDSASSTSNSIALTFTTSSWSNEQTVYFIVKDDLDTNGSINGVVNVQSSSTGDIRYNNLSESFNITIKDNDSTAIESIGTPAFTTGVFTVVFVDSNDTMVISDTDSTATVQVVEKKKNIDHSEIKTKTVTTYLHSDINLYDAWSNLYTSDTNYSVTQVPKSPYWTPTNKVFNYDLLYDDDIDN